MTWLAIAISGRPHAEVAEAATTVSDARAGVLTRELTAANARVGDANTRADVAIMRSRRGLHSSTSQLNLSRFFAEIGCNTINVPHKKTA